MVWGRPGQNLIDFLFQCQLKIKGNWSGTAQDRIWLISSQISSETEKKLVWGITGQNLIDFYPNFTWKLKEISVGKPRTETTWFLFKFQLRMKGNWSGEAQDRIWLISIQISIQNERKLVWGSPGQYLFDFYSNFNWQWTEIGLGQPGTESDFLWKVLQRSPDENVIHVLLHLHPPASQCSDVLGILEIPVRFLSIFN